MLKKIKEIYSRENMDKIGTATVDTPFFEYFKDRTALYFKPIFQLKNCIIDILTNSPLYHSVNKNIVPILENVKTNTREILNERHLKILENYYK